MGKCSTISNDLLLIINEAQQRLIHAGGDTGWWGSWARMVFNVVPSENPYIALPFDVARLINLDYCRTPVPIQNEFYEFLEAGIGLQGPGDCRDRRCGISMTFDRGGYPTFLDLEAGHILRIYNTEIGDIGKEILVQGTDINDQILYEDDGTVQGNSLALASPFVDSPILSSLTGIQKPVTVGPVQFYDIDPDTQDSTLILTMQPQETVGCYRRYFLGGLPDHCCTSTAVDTEDTDLVQVTAIGKFEYVPVKVASDYLVIQCEPAMIDAAMSVRYGKMDTPTALQMQREKMKSAIRELNGQLRHKLGTMQPAINFAPFGTAKLQYAGIGTLT